MLYFFFESIEFFTQNHNDKHSVEVMACVRSNTFSFNQSMKDARFNMASRISVMTDNMWSSIMDTVYYGQD